VQDVRLLTDPFDPNPAIDQLSDACPDAGGIASFVGKVRAGETEMLELSHYEPLTLPSMQDLAARAIERFALSGLVMIHRSGQMKPGDPIVCVAAAAAHRRGAIEAVDYCMDHLKSAAWFWKRELRADGWHWIEPRSEDYADLTRWA